MNHAQENQVRVCLRLRADQAAFNTRNVAGRTARKLRHDAEAAGAFTPVALVFLGGLVGGAALNFILPFQILPGGWFRAMGLVPLALGTGLLAWARAAFRRHRTALMPWTPSAALVQDGPYAFSRNPVYLAFCIMYLGLSLIFDSGYVLVMFFVVVVLFDRLQIPREENYLQAKFGEEFTSYRSRVRRWL